MNDSNIIYFDNASTTKVDDRIITTVMEYMSMHYGNASSSHRFGESIKNRVDSARESVSKLINCDSNEIIFTSGATESINTILGSAATLNDRKKNKIVTVATEHPSVLETCRFLENLGFDLVYLPVLSTGLLDLDLLKNQVDENTLLVCIMMVNNETGIIQPISEIAKIAHNCKALFLTDATQAMGKIPIDVQKSEIDILVFSGHKFYAPKGVGGFYINSRLKNQMVALLHGGGQEWDKRSGTLNVPGIIGIGNACTIAMEELETDKERIVQLRDYLEQKLLLIPGSFVNGNVKERIYNITNICFPNIDSDILIKMLDNICVSNGSACSTSVIGPSYVLQAMGLSDQDADSSVRFSLGKSNTMEEVIIAAERITQVIVNLNKTMYV